MTTALIHPAACIVEHTTIIRITYGNAGDAYCGLTTHSEGNQINCAATRRIGSLAPEQPVFDEASQYVTTVLLPNRKKESIVLIDHAFELTATREILNSFEFVQASSDGVIIRRSVDLKTHEAWAERVQLAVKLLLELGA